MKTPEQLLKLIRTGEGQTIEFRSDVRDPSTLARLIAAFANADGGILLIGVTESDGVPGINAENLNRRFSHALTSLDPPPAASLSIVQIDGRDVGVIEVPKSDGVVLSNGGAFVRVGDATRPMAPGEILRQLPTAQHEDRALLTRIADALSTQSELVQQQSEALQRQEQTITEMSSKFTKAQAPRGKIVEWLISGLIGAVLGQIVTSLF